MNTITKEWLKKKSACSDGIKWFLSQDERNTAKVLLKLVEENRVDDALWVLENTMNKKQSVQLAIFSARLVLENYEKKYQDDRPRKAIEAAEAYLKNPCARTKEAAFAAEYAARSAAEYAARSAAEYAARSAAFATRSARSAAEYAARSARSAARSARSAAEYAARSAARSAALKDTQLKIINEAIKIMGLK